MAQVTYRGVKYDTTDKSKKDLKENVQHLNYRGLNHDKKVAVCA